MGARALLQRARIAAGAAGSGAAFLCFVLIFATPAAQAATQEPSPWTWTDDAPTLLDVSCSSPGVCVAVGQRGRVLRGTEDGRSLAWSSVQDVKPSDELTGVTCTHLGLGRHNFCLAVSNTSPASDTFQSKIYRSTDHGATWSGGVALRTASGTKDTKSALGLACDPAADACYAVGLDGGVWWSTNEGRSWAPLKDLPPVEYRRVACPERRTCVAVGGAEKSAVIEGQKVTAVEPAPGLSGGIHGLACDSATRCIATDGSGQFTTMDLATSPKVWGNAQPFGGAVDPDVAALAMACPGKDECVGLLRPEGIGVAAHAHSVTTTALSAQPVLWQQSPLTTTKAVAISCAGTTCVAVGQSGVWFVGHPRPEGGTDWARVNEVGNFATIQCSAAFAPTCVAGGMSAIGLSQSEGKRWSLPFSGQTVNIGAIGCTSPSTCLFVGQMQTRRTTDFKTFPLTTPPTTGVAGASPQDCITGSLCVAFGDHVVYTTRDAAESDWVPSEDFPLGAGPKAACVPKRTDPPTCVAIGEINGTSYIEVGTMNLVNDHWTWRHVSRARPILSPSAVACSAGGECTAVNNSGEIQSSKPGTNLTDWSKIVLPDKPKLSAVACPANGHCVAGGLSGSDAIIASTTDNWAKFSIDLIPLFPDRPAVNILAFGCETTTRCVAVGEGVAFIGKRI